MEDPFIEILVECEPYIKKFSSRFSLQSSGLYSNDLQQDLRLCLLEAHRANKTNHFLEGGKPSDYAIDFLRRSANRIKMKEYRKWHRV